MTEKTYRKSYCFALLAISIIFVFVCAAYLNRSAVVDKVFAYEKIDRPEMPNDNAVLKRETKADGSEILSRATGKVTENGISEVLVVGDRIKGGEFIENIRIIVRDLRGKNKSAGIKIVPKINYGYSPVVTLADFTGNGVKEIFYQSNSGGNGAFSYSYVYSVASGEAVTLFDFDKVPDDFTAEYADYYKVVVKNTATGAVYYIDISGRGEEYLGGLYNPDGTLKTPVAADISVVNTVLPFFRAEENKFGLLILRRITGLYSADSFGYTQEFFSYGENGFSTYFEGVLINRN